MKMVSNVQGVIRYVILAWIGAFYPMAVWRAVLFGGPDLATFQGETYFSILGMTCAPTVIGVFVILLLRMEAKEKVRSIASFSTPFVLISLYYLMNIYFVFE